MSNNTDLEQLEQLFRKYAEQREYGHPTPYSETRLEAERQAFEHCADVVSELQRGEGLDELIQAADVDLEAAKQRSREST